MIALIVYFQNHPKGNQYESPGVLFMQSGASGSQS